ncbi:Dihydrolipoyl dehydrogenase [Planctomycetes bacterium Pla163]|uniref:Dihydrolipoyl dehydrogenase n=1 Tax=Rohdeia mirabilis TaxID=2528008 RepID=A0A518D3Z2_9BACT|nr:Dihydrolipoyl dehydrogenase [Planctomycetes bacterium Pla163]
MSKNVVVIGAGPAGYVCAIRLAQLGNQVTVVEKDALGGTCLNVGCIPSKALIAAGALLDKARHAETMGITFGTPKVDVGKLVEWKSAIVGKLTGGVGGLLKNHGCKVVRGDATFTGPKTVKVSGGADGDVTLTGDHIVIATGSVPINIPGFTCDEKDVWSSTGGLAPTEIPGHLVVIGGGYIGLELGMMYSKLGSKVTVLEASPGALPGQERDCVKVIERSLKKMKIEMLTKTFAKSWKKKGSKTVVSAEVDGKMREIECDQVLSTVGRRPFTEGLGLDKAGLAVNDRGFLEVDSQLRTKVPHIFAIGDVAGQPMLAHKGSKEGLVAAAVISGQPDEYDVRCVPAVIFTSPEMASVGLTEDQVKEKGLEYKTGSFPFAASGRAMSLMETDGFVKIISDAKTDEILGVHMVGPEVTELIAEATLAIEMGATVEDIARTIHAHPTLPEAMMEAAEAVHKMAVHIYQKP